MAKKKITYSDNIKELESILSQMNNGDVSIDQLQEKVKRAKELLQWCKDKLRATEEELSKE